jgi:hypothetical protein
MFSIPMEFEFDPRKSASKRTRHGIDFIQAQGLWADPDHVEIPARTAVEPRSLVVGRIEGKHGSAVVTPRDGRTRMISVRRARSEEIKIHEGA